MTHGAVLELHRPMGPIWQMLRRIALAWHASGLSDLGKLLRKLVAVPYGRAGCSKDQCPAIHPKVQEAAHGRLYHLLQGPFTGSGEGRSCTGSYDRIHLGGPKVEPLKQLMEQLFQALVTCVMRARRTLDILPAGRGPEMTSVVME